MKVLSRKKILIENFLIYGLGNIAGKIIPFLLLPIITRLITDPAIFGNYDLFKVLSSFGATFAGLGVLDAMFRYYYDKEDTDYQLSVYSTSLFIVFSSSLLLFLLCMFLSVPLANFFFYDEEYSIIIKAIGLLIFIDSIKNILMRPFRLLNKRKIIILLGWLSPLSTYLISIPLIIYWQPLPALILGALISPLIVAIISYKLNRFFFKYKNINLNLGIKLLKFGVPLIPTFLIYWVFNSIDRVMITKYLDSSSLGLYAIGAKLGMLSQFIYVAFAQGHSYFLYSTMKYDDRVEKNSKIFEFFVALIFLAFILINPIIKPLYSILFAPEYFEGHIVTPYLFLSPLFLMLFQLSASQTLIDKKSYISTLLLLPGLFLNIGLNWVLIPRIGIEGAAVATFSGYLLSVILAVLITSNRKLLLVNNKSIIVFILLVTTLFISKIMKSDLFIQSIISLFGLLSFFIIYYNEIKRNTLKLTKQIKKKR